MTAQKPKRRAFRRKKVELVWESMLNKTDDAGRNFIELSFLVTAGTVDGSGVKIGSYKKAVYEPGVRIIFNSYASITNAIKIILEGANIENMEDFLSTEEIEEAKRWVFDDEINEAKNGDNLEQSDT